MRIPKTGEHHEYQELTDEQKIAVTGFITQTYQPREKGRKYSAYLLKHIFERSPQGFYVTQGQYKGALLASGFFPCEEARHGDWLFHLGTAQECKGRLRARLYGTIPCHGEPDIESGLCSYHEMRQSRGFPIIPDVYPNREAWIEARGYGKCPQAPSPPRPQTATGGCQGQGMMASTEQALAAKEQRRSDTPG